MTTSTKLQTNYLAKTSPFHSNQWYVYTSRSSPPIRYAFPFANRMSRTVSRRFPEKLQTNHSPKTPEFSRDLWPIYVPNHLIVDGVKFVYKYPKDQKTASLINYYVMGGEVFSCNDRWDQEIASTLINVCKDHSDKKSVSTFDVGNDRKSQENVSEKDRSDEENRSKLRDVRLNLIERRLIDKKEKTLDRFFSREKKAMFYRVYSTENNERFDKSYFVYKDGTDQKTGRRLIDHYRIDGKLFVCKDHFDQERASLLLESGLKIRQSYMLDFALAKMNRQLMKSQEIQMKDRISFSRLSPEQKLLLKTLMLYPIACMRISIRLVITLIKASAAFLMVFLAPVVASSLLPYPLPRNEKY